MSRVGALGCGLMAMALVLLSGAPAEGQAVDRSGSRMAREKQREAQVEFNRRNSTLHGIQARLKAEFESRDEWVRAQADLKKAQADYEAAKKPVMDALAKKPDYQKAAQAKQKAEAERDALKDARNAADKLYDAATRVMDANLIITKLENDALAADPKVQAAKKQLAEAQAAVTALNKQFQDEIQGNAEWAEARKLTDDAQIILAQATKEVTEATKREAEQIRSQQESQRNQRRSSRSSSGRGY